MVDFYKKSSEDVEMVIYSLLPSPSLSLPPLPLLPLSPDLTCPLQDDSRVTTTQPQEGNSTFVISILNLQVSDDGRYGVKATNEEGSTPEEEISLTVTGETQHTIQQETMFADLSHMMI